jgi:hypothetical protein
MSQNSGLSLSAINPQIGDNVRVYHDSSFEIELKVVERRWHLTNGASPELHCWLSVPSGWNIIDFEKMLRVADLL